MRSVAILGAVLMNLIPFLPHFSGYIRLFELSNIWSGLRQLMKEFLPAKKHYLAETLVTFLFLLSFFAVRIVLGTYVVLFGLRDALDELSNLTLSPVKIVGFVCLVLYTLNNYALLPKFADLLSTGKITRKRACN
jgi:hypothetical protein